MEAEFHAVWNSPRGELIDVTPKRLPVRYILFLRDSKRKFEGRRVLNIRHPLANDALLIEYLSLFEAHHEAISAAGGEAY